MSKTRTAYEEFNYGLRAIRTARRHFVQGRESFHTTRATKNAVVKFLRHLAALEKQALQVFKASDAGQTEIDTGDDE